MKLLIFHPTIAPYRIDFFNDLYNAFETRICLEYRNLKDQKFDYDKIESQFTFRPIYLENSENGGIWKHLNEFEPDIVLVSEYNQIALKVILHRFLERKKYKIVSICDDSYNMVAENNDFSKKHRIARRIVVPMLDELVLVDSRTKEWYKKNYGKGFYFPIIKPDEKAREEYNRIIPLSKEYVTQNDLYGKKIILFVGRLVALKNVESAIRAFSRLDQKENVFVVVGDGPEKENLRALSKELGTSTIFTGRLEGDTLYAWYCIAQVFILPSYLEAFGAVTNEALLAGCKSLISNKAGSQCLIVKGINGDTFNSMDIEEIAQKIQKAFDDVKPLERIELRENLMQVSYNDFMKDLITKLKDLV